jgi:hypothetical protein
MHINRKIIFIALCILVGAGLMVFFTQTTGTRNSSIQPNTIIQKELKNPVVTLVLNDGGRVSTYSGITAQNAFEALTVVTEKENIPLVTKKYDFGTFIQKIGEKESGSEMAWIYFINDASGNVAADKAELTTGDTVEWKYTKSIY